MSYPYKMSEVCRDCGRPFGNHYGAFELSDRNGVIRQLYPCFITCVDVTYDRTRWRSDNDKRYFHTEPIDNQQLDLFQ